MGTLCTNVTKVAGWEGNVNKWLSRVVMADCVQALHSAVA